MNVATLVKLELDRSFPALKHRNFRVFWMGMCISVIGTWMQNISMPWLAYSMTGSPFLLSLVGALQFTPVLLFSLFAGVIIDRLPKKKILIYTQAFAMIFTLSLAFLYWSGYIQYWHLLVFSTLLGLVNTLDMPTRQAFVIELVGKEDLMNAVALNSSIFNAGRVIGPAIAGLIMGYAGIGVCFFLNGLSYIAVLIGLYFVKVEIQPKGQEYRKNIFKEVGEGLRYVVKDEILLKTVLSAAIVGTFAMNFSVLVPVFSKIILQQGEAGFGLLMSCLGVGSLIGAVSLAARSKEGPKSTIITFFPIALSILLILAGFTGTFLLTAFFLALCGFTFVTFAATANSTLQLQSRDEFRGRVTSLYALVFAGTTPFGNLYAGGITDRFGARAGFIGCGVAVLFFTGLLWLIRKRKTNQTIQYTADEN